MKIVHFISNGSRSNYFNDIVANIEAGRWDLTVGSLGPSGDLQRDMKARGIKTFSLNCLKRSGYPAAMARLSRLLYRGRFQIFHSHLMDASLVGLAAARLARTPVRVMTRHHSDVVMLSGSRRAVLLDRILSRHLAPHIVAPSNAVERALTKYDRISESKVSLIPLGFDWHRIRSDARAAVAVQRNLCRGARPILCTVGRLDRFKGHDVLIEAFAEAGLPDSARLLIVGGGPEEGRLQDLARSLRVQDRVIFAGHRADVYDVMAASDLIVHPSFSEAQNQVIIEALALALPVVATAVGAAEDVIHAGRTGWLVPPRDRAALALAIREALDDPGRARDMALAGQVLVRSMYPIELMITSYDALYESLLVRSERGRNR